MILFCDRWPTILHVHWEVQRPNYLMIYVYYRELAQWRKGNVRPLPIGTAVMFVHAKQHQQPSQHPARYIAHQKPNAQQSNSYSSHFIHFVSLYFSFFSRRRFKATVECRRKIVVKVCYRWHGLTLIRASRKLCGVKSIKCQG